MPKNILQKITAPCGLGVLMALLSCAGAFFPASAASVAPATSAAPAFMPHSDAHITVLKNGLTVYILKDDRFPLVSTRLYVKTGSANESPEDAGISHVLEHMVFKGTQRRPKGAISAEVEAAGGYLNAATSFDYTVYQTDMPSEHWALGIDIVKDMAFHATLDGNELESEKEVILSELQRGQDNPGQRIFKELHTAALQGTPYDHPIIGFEETIKAVTPQSMRQYIAKYYQPQNMLLTVVGNVDVQKVLEMSQMLLGQLQNTTEITPVQPINAADLTHSTVHVQEGAWNKVYLGMALPVPGLTDVRSVPLDILSMVLGGDATSYLYKKYKYDMQLVDSISVANYGFERVGLLYVTVELEAKNVEAFWQEFTKDMASLTAKSFTDKQLDRAKLQMEDSTHRAKETLSGLASWKGYTELFLGGEQGEKNFLTAMDQVTLHEIQNALDTWFVSQRLHVAVLAPKGTELPDLQGIVKKNWPAKKMQKQSADQKNTGETTIIDLGQGRTVVLIPDPTLPYTALDFYLSGGNALSGGKQGLATLTSSVLTSGTQSKSSQEIDVFLAERVASLGAGAGRQVFWLSSKQPSRFNGDMFALIQDVLKHPALSPDEVAREKKNQMAAIHSRDDQPLGYAFSKMAPFFFGEEHPYGFKSLGDIDKVEAYTPQDVAAFWKKQIAQPWVLSVAGDFDAEEVLAFAQNLPKPSQAKIEVGAPTWGKEKNLEVHVPGRDQAHHMLVFKTVPSDHSDAAALELLQLTLEGQSGLLFRELRDNQGLGYSVTANKSFLPTTGYLLFYMGTEPQKVEQAHKGFKEIIVNLQKDLLPEAEVQRAKNQMEGDFYRSNQSLRSRSHEAAMRLTLGHDLDFRKKTIAKAKELTAQDLRRVAQKYLKLEDAYIINVLP